MFYIDPETNTIFWSESNNEPEGRGTPFSTPEGLQNLADNYAWSKQSVTNIWNSFAGTAGPFADLKPVKMFRNRPYGLTAIWKAIQRLAPSDAASEPETAASATVVKPRKAKAKKKAAAKKAAPKPAAKAGNKREEVIRLISRKNGASGAEIQEAMGWLPHTTRGLLSTLKSKGGLPITSEKHATRGRVYRIAS